jgi:hypothetical protein
MTKTTRWVRPKGPQAPRPGTKLRVQLEQNVDGRPLHPVGSAEVFEGGLALLKLTDTEAGRIAAELLREDCLDPCSGARSRRCDSGKGGDMADLGALLGSVGIGGAIGKAVAALEELGDTGTLSGDELRAVLDLHERHLLSRRGAAPRSSNLRRRPASIGVASRPKPGPLGGPGSSASRNGQLTRM